MSSSGWVFSVSHCSNLFSEFANRSRDSGCADSRERPATTDAGDVWNPDANATSDRTDTDLATQWIGKGLWAIGG